MENANTASSLQGCSCNQQLKDAAQQQGFSNNAVAVSESLCSFLIHPWTVVVLEIVALPFYFFGQQGIASPPLSLTGENNHYSKFLRELQLGKTLLCMTLASKYRC